MRSLLNKRRTKTDLISIIANNVAEEKKLQLDNPVSKGAESIHCDDRLTSAIIIHRSRDYTYE